MVKERDELELITLPDRLADICVLLTQGRVDGISVGEKETGYGEVLEVLGEEEEDWIWRRAYAAQYRRQGEIKKGFIDSTVEIGTGIW